MNIPVLDSGYVKFIEAWGHGEHSITEHHANHEIRYRQDDMECGIIEAARQSTQGSFRGWDPPAEVDCSCGLGLAQMGNPALQHKSDCDYLKGGDKRLLKFLYSNNHMTPFEFAGMVIEVQAPIFVFREWHRHRTQSYNEMSARYEPLPDLYYMPSREIVAARAKEGAGHLNKQAASVTAEHSPEGLERATDYFLDHLYTVYESSENLYLTALKRGIPKELARLSMPVGHYSRMRASANLRNWLSFLTLRQDPKAQWEIRQYANAVASLISQSFPRTYQCFIDRARAGT